MIELKKVNKVYKVSNREKGLKGAIKGVFKPAYKEIKAVDDLDMKIEKGEIVGLIGTNGAGKSTTIKMMCGILYPTSGEIEVNGLIPYKKRKQNAANIGVVFGQRTQLIWDIALEEALRLQRSIYNVDKEVFEERLKYFIELLELEDIIRKPVRQMSLGQKMRGELAAAFLHKPKIVYLDEPTIGLDVRIKEVIRKFILEIVKRDETTVVLTTHDMKDIEELADRIIMIDNGKVIFKGTQKQLHDKFGGIKTIEIILQNNQEFKVSQVLESKINFWNQEEYNVTIQFSLQNVKVEEVIKEIIKENQIYDMTILDTQLETIVKKLYEEKRS